MYHSLTAAELPAATAMTTLVNPTIPYSSFTPALSTITPARISASDVVLVLRYVGADLTGVLQATQFDQTDGTDPVGGTMVVVAHDKTVNVPLPTDLAQRYAAVRPGGRRAVGELEPDRGARCDGRRRVRSAAARRLARDDRHRGHGDVRQSVRVPRVARLVQPQHERVAHRDDQRDPASR